MGRSYVIRGVIPPRYWEPSKGDVVYVEGTKTRIARVGTQDGTPYVWFRPHVRGTFAMSVGNLKQVARIEPRGPLANPRALLSRTWTRGKVRRLKDGRVQVAVTGRGRK